MNFLSILLLFLPVLIAASAGGEVIEWSSYGVNLPDKLSNFAVARNPDNGLIYFAGGCNSANGAKYDSKKGAYQCSSVTSMLREFNPNTNSFRFIANMPRARYRHGMAFASNKLWVIGGRDLDDKVIRAVDVFDFGLYRWVTAGDFPQGISDNAVAANGDYVYVFGGYTQNYLALSNVWRIDARDNSQVTVISRAPIPAAHGAARIKAANNGIGEVTVGGGYSHYNCAALTGVYRYNYNNNNWSTDQPLKQGRAEMATAFLDGYFLALGGETEFDPLCFAIGPNDETGIVQDTLEILDGSFNYDTSFPSPRFRFEALTVGSQVLVFGGQDAYDPGCDCYPASNEVWTGKFVDAPETRAPTPQPTVATPAPTPRATAPPTPKPTAPPTPKPTAPPTTMPTAPPTPKPTAPPTPKPTPATTSGENDDGRSGPLGTTVSPTPTTPAFCFPGEVTVEVYGKGLTLMRDLKLGDEVKVASGRFSQVYSFGHYDQNVKAHFLSISAIGLRQPLELSPNHMVLVQHKGVIPSQMVSVGDKLALVDGDAVVTSIKTVQRTGAFAPFTREGTLVVNDVIASSYVSLQPSSAFLVIGSVDTVSMHSVAHLFQAPHRLACDLIKSCCETETYDNGLSAWIKAQFYMSQWLLKQNSMVVIGVLFPLLVLALAAYVGEMILWSSWMTFLGCSIACTIVLLGGARRTSDKRLK